MAKETPLLLQLTRYCSMFQHERRTGSAHRSCQSLNSWGYLGYKNHLLSSTEICSSSAS